MHQAGKNLAGAVERNKTTHWNKFRATYCLLYLARSTPGEVGAGARALIQELAIRRVKQSSELYSKGFAGCVGRGGKIDRLT